MTPASSTVRRVDSSRCACGSGLSGFRCCESVLATVAPEGADPHLTALLESAGQAYRDGDPDTAGQLCVTVLESEPARLEALQLLYRIRKASARPQAAEALARRMVTLNPNDLWATTELGLLLLEMARLSEAEVHARNAVRLAPANSQAHNLLAMVLTEAHKPQLGEYHYRKVLQLSGRRDPIVLANLGWNLKNQGRIDEARELYEESVALAPDVPQTLLGWARLEEAGRRFERAAKVLDVAEARFPDEARFKLTRAVLLGRQGRYADALTALEAIARRSGEDGLGTSELLEKGALLDRMGRYDEAFAAFDAGKRKARAMGAPPYAAEEAQHLAAQLKAFFTAGRLSILPRAGVRDATPQPIFVLGFPRSGTTLVEQMLSAHPRVAAGDELPLIGQIAGMVSHQFCSPLGYPTALAELWMADHHDGLDELRDHYLRNARRLGAMQKAGAAWFTDKMPLNETHLGFIALLFPQAPLIHVIRHPLDVVLSVFANDLTHGFCCAYEMETAARHYVLVTELVEHYRREMTLRYLPIRYEAIVEDQAASLRRMLDFIGEEFDPNCLDFHENRRYARTASYAQVTEKLYDRSRFRYRNYLRHLAPVIPMLRPIIERMGYSIEAAA